MPELPDVESFKEYFQSVALKKEIAEVCVRSNRILSGITEDALKQRFVGKKFVSCTRHGKYLFGQAEADLWLVLHFGMTGSLGYFKKTDGEPPHSRLLLCFANGYCLAFIDPRKFGHITITTGVSEFVSAKHLGPDALQIDYSAFKTLASKSRGTVKSTLLNQHLLAGIGNIYADEILFQAGIHPQASTSKLTEAALKALFDSMQRVLTFAVDFHADSAKFPKSYLIHYRRKGAKCPKDGEVATAKISGRTTYFCPATQKMPP